MGHRGHLGLAMDVAGDQRCCLPVQEDTKAQSCRGASEGPSIPKRWLANSETFIITGTEG